MQKVERIERIVPPEGPPEVPVKTPRGYKMADPTIGANRHHAIHAIYMGTLEEGAEGLKRGLSLWMKQPNKRETLIAASSLRVVRR